MNFTNVYTTRKLQKKIQKTIVAKHSEENKVFGEWVATVFHIKGKKCWLIMHKSTKFVLIIPNVKSSDLSSITQIFSQTFHSQLEINRIKVDYENLSSIVGEIRLCETNNDRSTIGSLNNCMHIIDHWKMEIDDFLLFPFQRINNSLNSMPNKMLGWKSPNYMMKSLVEQSL